VKTDYEYPKGVGRDLPPDCVSTLLDGFKRIYPAAQGYVVTGKRDHSNDSARWLIYVHQGLTAGFSVLVSAPFKRPTSVTTKVSWSSKLLRIFAGIAFVVGVAVGVVVMVAGAQDHGPNRPQPIAVVLTCTLLAMVVYGVGWVIARAVAGAAGNPFNKEKLQEIAGQVAKVVTDDGARAR
jgi:hypothetical protein